MIKDFFSKKLGDTFFWIIVIFFIALRLYAVFTLPYLAKEPEDALMFYQDISRFFNYTFNSYGPDQGRLPTLISWPLAWTFTNFDFIPVRLFFMIFHFWHIYLAYQFSFLVSQNQTVSRFVVLFLLISTYIASFSVFAIMTIGSLYFLLHLFCIFYFYKLLLREEKEKITFNYLTLSLLLALCTASKFFGVFLVFCFGLFHLWKNRATSDFYVRSISPKICIGVGYLFLIFVLIANFFMLYEKKFGFKLLLVLAFLFLIYFALILRKENYSPSNRIAVSKITLWHAIVINTICLIMIFSPVHLNILNFFGATSWFGNWNTGDLVLKSKSYDMWALIILKFGLVSFVFWLIAFYYVLREKLYRHNLFKLFLFIFLSHMTVISIVKYRCAWYPLAIFGFLYLIPITFLNHALKVKQYKKIVLALVLCFGILADNAVRYFYWYPYAHLDGAQYGRSHIGWNKAGMVTWEVMPQTTDYVIGYYKSAGKPIQINVQVIYVRKFNLWFIHLFNRDLLRKGALEITLTERTISLDTQSELILTSPVYDLENEDHLLKNGYKLLKVFSVKKIPIISIWENKLNQKEEKP